ncbi:uncharacterized protein B0P05DRAFT_448215, partial [Gilbertella persicaria]|uniref:uncharacterized protein n=1 Tax=Gilbertella persicaria TaxID=101096 RepID=UPI0022210C7F
SSVSPSAWKLFWCMTFTSVQRNSIYRLLTGKVPTKSLLFNMALSTAPNPFCSFCQEVETVFHFFFRCPQKFIFWDIVIREFLWPGTSIDDISSALQSLDFNKINVNNSCPIEVEMLLVIALSELWKAHWTHMHRREPFLASIAFSQTLRAVGRRAAEETNC